MRIAVYEVREDEAEALEMMKQKYGIELVLSKKILSPETIDLAKGCEGISILGQGKIDQTLLSRCHQMGIRYLSTRTIGYDHIDLEAAKCLGIQVCNARYSPNGVANFTVMMILMCLRNYKQALWRGQVNDFSLTGLIGRDMDTLTIGVIGAGRIGQQVLKNLSGFGCRLLAYDPSPQRSSDTPVEFVDLETLYRESDVITLHMPLLPSTRHLINQDSIAKMKDGVVIINCARGELMDIDALISGIETEKIGALGMDTVEGDEGIIHHDHRTDILSNQKWFYLHQFRNVIMTQHMAFYTKEAVQQMVQCGIEGLWFMKQGIACPTKL